MKITATLFLALLSAISALAQSNVVFGYLLSLDQTPRPGVAITLTSLRTDEVRSAVTASNGFYSFTNLAWGEYRRVIGGEALALPFYASLGTTGTVDIASLAPNGNYTRPVWYSKAEVDTLIDLFTSIKANSLNGHATNFTSHSDGASGAISLASDQGLVDIDISTGSLDFIVQSGGIDQYSFDRPIVVPQVYSSSGGGFTGNGSQLYFQRTNAFTASDLPAMGFGFWNSNGIGAIYVSFKSGGNVTNKAVAP